MVSRIKGYVTSLSLSTNTESEIFGHFRRVGGKPTETVKFAVERRLCQSLPWWAGAHPTKTA
jgi:hypothetical protein